MTSLSAPTDSPQLDTWPKVLLHNASLYGKRRQAMRYKHYGIWQSYTWDDYFSWARYIALGLRSLGFGPGSRLLVVGDNCAEWYFGAMAAQCNRGVVVGLYSTLSAAEIEHIARSSQAEFAFVQDQEQVDKLLAVCERLPNLKHLLFWRYKGLSGSEYEGLVGLRELVARGREWEAAHRSEFENTLAAGTADDVCAIVYTSGASGEVPKGALHTHRSLMTSAAYFARQDHFGQADSLASALPPAWITEQILAFGCHLLSGGTVNFAESEETLQDDLREVAPTVFIYSSRLWESLIGQVEARLRGADAFKRWVSKRLMPVGGKMAEAKENGAKPGLWLRGAHALADWVVLRHIRDGLGLSRARLAYAFGATLSPDALRFFRGMGVPLKSVYCSAEAGAVSGAGVMTHTLGSVGFVNPGVEVRLTERGEMLVRGEGAFRGYCDLGPSARELGLEGWVFTGDCAILSEGGELVLADRVEDLVLFPDGDSFAPQQVESRLRYSPYIQDAWVFADSDRQSVSAVIVVDFQNAGRWADKKRVAYTTYSDLSQKPQIYELIGQEIARVNKDLPEGHHIRRFVNLHKEFHPDEQELTRDRKLRRRMLAKRYPDLVEALREGRSSVELDAEIVYQDGRTGRLRTVLRIATVKADGI